MLLFKIMKILSKMISFNLIKDGEDGKPGEPGKPGPMPINAGQWNETIEYIKDEISVPYVWQLNNSNNKREYYLLMKSISLGDNPYINNTQGSGDIWRRVEKLDLILARKIQADEINTKNLVSTHVKTAESGPRITLSGSEMKVYGLGEFPNIIFGVDNNGYAVMTYYSNDGRKIYDLGPRGISDLGFVGSSWTEMYYYKLSDYKKLEDLSFSDLFSIRNTVLRFATMYYKWYAGSNPTIPDEEKEKEEYLYLGQNLEGGYIPDGWYFTPPETLIPENRDVYPTEETGRYIKPGNKAIYETMAGVRDTYPVVYESIICFHNGKAVDSVEVYWNA